MKTSADIERTIHEYNQRRSTIFYPKTDDLFLPGISLGLKDTRVQDLDKFRSLAVEICERRLGCKPALIEPITTAGTFHLVFKVTDTDNKAYVIRLNRFPDLTQSWSLYHDVSIYPLLYERGLRVPHVLEIDCSRRICPTDYEILTYVDGRPLNAYENQETQFMDPDLISAVGAYVARVHTIKLKCFGPLRIGFIEGLLTTWADYIFLRFEEHVAVCVGIGAISKDEADNIREAFERHRNFFMISDPALLHGDLGNHNFISADGKSINALIDWEDAMSGDPIFDIAFWGTFFKDHMLKDFVAGYTTIASLPHDFEKRYWLYYLRVALSKTVHRFRFGYQDPIGRPSASRRIQKALCFFK